MVDHPDDGLGPLKPVFDPETGKWRVSRTGRLRDGLYSFDSESEARDWIVRATGKPQR
jgi:hypothetical protein